jgi:hypothetical protein
MQARHAAGNWLGRARARRRAWGRSLREYMRDYNHWATMDVLNELLPYLDNRVTLARRPTRTASGRCRFC